MTHRDEQDMRRRIESTPAEYLRLVFQNRAALTVLILSGSVRVAVRSILRLLRRPCLSIGHLEAASERVIELTCLSFDQRFHGLRRRLQLDSLEFDPLGRGGGTQLA